jgi:hypothetical protein
MELFILVTPGVSIKTICVLASKSVKIPMVGSSVVLYLSETAETFWPTMKFKSEDFPAFGAPTRQTSMLLEPSGESLKTSSASIKAWSGIL